MAVTLTADALQDEFAISLACVLAVANKRAREAGIEIAQSLVSITQQTDENHLLWRINYGPKDYVGRRGGDLIVEVDSSDVSIKRVLRGQ